LKKKINQQFNQSIFITREEADLFRKVYPGAENIEIVSNGVDYDFFAPDETKIKQSFSTPMLMFSGAMDYYANVDGVTWFADKILPVIKKKFQI
jgi:glycosyltransferase involved in cell wall biosynthesis